MKRLINYYWQKLIEPMRLLRVCVVAMVVTILAPSVNITLAAPQGRNNSTPTNITKQAKDYIGCGDQYLDSKQYQKAIDSYSKAITMNKNLVEVYCSRGVAYYYLEQDQKAIGDFSKAIELNSNFAPAYVLRGSDYCKLKQYQKAIKDCSKAVELSPCPSLAAQFYLCRGEVYSKAGQYQNAIDDCSRALAIKLDSDKLTAEAYHYMGKAYDKLGKHDFAKSYLAWAHKFGYNPEQEDLWMRTK